MPGVRHMWLAQSDISAFVLSLKYGEEKSACKAAFLYVRVVARFTESTRCRTVVVVRSIRGMPLAHRLAEDDRGTTVEVT